MEFNDLLTKDAHEEGAEVEIKNPDTGKGTGFFVKVLGVDSVAFQKAQRSLRALAVKAMAEDDELSFEDELEAEIDCLVSVTVGWRGIESGGKDKPFSKKACKELYEKSAGVRQQVDRFVGDRRNFTKG